MSWFIMYLEFVRGESQGEGEGETTDPAQNSLPTKVVPLEVD